MTKIKNISPFAGKPFTKSFNSKDEGEGYCITIREFTPFSLQLAEFLSGLSFLAIAGFTIFSLIKFKQHILPQDMAIYGLISFLIWLTLKKCLDYFCKKVTTVKITANNFTAQSLFSHKKYDRQLQHKYLILRHDETQNEQRRQALLIEKARKRGKVMTPRAIYGESYHLVFEHMGQRRDITSIYGRKEALAVLARLKACDEVVTSKTQNGSDGIATNPQDQWGDQAGEIPNDK